MKKNAYQVAMVLSAIAMFCAGLSAGVHSSPQEWVDDTLALLKRIESHFFVKTADTVSRSITPLLKTSSSAQNLFGNASNAERFSGRSLASVGTSNSPHSKTLMRTEASASSGRTSFKIKHRMPPTLGCLKAALENHKPNADLKKCGLDGLNSATASVGASPDDVKADLQFAYWTYVAASDNGQAIWEQTLEAITAQNDPENQATIVCEFVQIYPEHSQKLIDTLALRGIEADSHCLTAEAHSAGNDSLGPQSKIPENYLSGDVALNSIPQDSEANTGPHFDCQDDLSCWDNWANGVLDNNSPAIIDDPSASPSPTPTPTPSPSPSVPVKFDLKCFSSSAAVNGELTTIPGLSQAVSNLTASGTVTAFFPAGNAIPPLEGSHQVEVSAAITVNQGNYDFVVVSDSKPNRWKSGSGDPLQLYGGSFGIMNPYFIYWNNGTGMTYFEAAVCWLTPWMAPTFDGGAVQSSPVPQAF